MLLKSPRWAGVLAALLALPAAAEQTEPVAIAAMQTMLQQHDSALNAKDLTAILATYSDNPKTVLLGTGPGEAWVGKEQIAQAYQHFLADFDAGTLNTDCGWKVFDVQGDSAWLTAMCHVTDALKDAKREYALNVSATLVKEGEQWRFRAFHFSNLTSGEPPAAAQ